MGQRAGQVQRVNKGCYKADRRWSDRYLPAAKEIVGKHMLVASDLKIDTQQATDLVLLRAKDLDIACRIREFQYLNKYEWEFTIRSARDSGVETEKKKILKGFADWMFYGFASSTDTSIVRWYLIRLASWRYHMTCSRASIRMGSIPNGDGTYFEYYDVRTFPPDPPLLIASSHEVPSLLEDWSGFHKPPPKKDNQLKLF